MKRIVFKHIRNTHNVGDFACCPLDYLHFENAVAMDLDEHTPACDAVVFGGGKIFGSLVSKMNLHDRQANHRVAWGVSTVQSSIFAFRYYLSRRQMTLVGSRDYGDARYDYAPCTSGLSPLFDRTYKTQHEIAFYLHKTKSEHMKIEVPSGVPVLSNFSDSMQTAIEFLGSADVVVSNSYHGVYWALLLGKRVLCLPFSKKFMNYRFAPAYSTPDRWQKDIRQAQSHHYMLEVVRNASVDFERKVRLHLL
jgi:hypothetical protein